MHANDELGWLETDLGQLFLSYHEPAPGIERSTAILLCYPFGSERMNLHLTYREIAVELARLGFPALRIDYPGTCDSSGSLRESFDIEAWCRTLDVGADWLKEKSGAIEIGVFGALLGGTLATLLASRRSDVQKIALWGAHASGKAFLREIRAFRKMTTANSEGRKPSEWREGDEEAIGFLMPKDSVAALAAIDLKNIQGQIAKQAGVFKRNRNSSEKPIIELLESHGAEVTPPPEAVVDLDEMFDVKSKPPPELIRQIVDWFVSVDRPAKKRAPSKSRLAHQVSVANHRGTALREEFVRFGPDKNLVGVLTHPVNARDLPPVILVNGGSNHRVGINRNYVDWARDWAEHGLTILRIDYRGLGDSPPESPEHAASLYREETIEDVRSAIDFLEERTGSKQVFCGGLCAGGYHAFHTALNDSRVVGLFMLNPLRFQKADEKKADGHATLAHYAQSALSLDRWKKVARGEVDVAGVTKSIATRVLRRSGSRISSAITKRPAAATWLAGSMLELTERGCHVLIVFNSSEEIRARVEEDLSIDREALNSTGRFRIELIDQTDHIFSPLWSQEHLGKLLEARLLEFAV